MTWRQLAPGHLQLSCCVRPEHVPCAALSCDVNHSCHCLGLSEEAFACRPRQAPCRPSYWRHHLSQPRFQSRTGQIACSEFDNNWQIKPLVDLATWPRDHYLEGRGEGGGLCPFVSTIWHINVVLSHLTEHNAAPLGQFMANVCMIDTVVTGWQMKKYNNIVFPGCSFYISGNMVFLSLFYFIYLYSFW